MLQENYRMSYDQLPIAPLLCLKIDALHASSIVRHHSRAKQTTFPKKGKQLSGSTYIVSIFFACTTYPLSKSTSSASDQALGSLTRAGNTECY